jgi:hypothetical protein
MTRIGVIADWERAQRGNAWPSLLSEIDPSFQITVYPIADLIVDPADRLHQIHREQVLIVNWDAANGDPEFGSHLCQAWLRHRRPEIIQWVRRGGVLLIESQATLGTPSPDAYAAAVGVGELPASGLEDRGEPLQGLRRSGTTCRKTKRFPTGGAFAGVDSRIEAAATYADVVAFPPTTTGLLIEVLEELRPKVILWRGWFRRTLPYSRDFPWISILESDDPGVRRQSTMQVACIGAGAIFATTMLLATNRQKPLVRAIVQSVSNTAALPRPAAAIEQVKSWLKTGLTVFGGLLAGSIPTRISPVATWLSSHLAGALSADPASLNRYVGLALLPIGILLVEIVRRVAVAGRKAVRGILGY